ncbi:MAG: cation:proton antiporter, partial [Patescibacteria group bacterium]|nr:cation:proton antiporter [Patescibacteria group bacterium]
MSRLIAAIVRRWFLVFLAWSACASAAWADAGASALMTEPTPTLTHRMMVLILQLGVVLFVARLGGLAFERVRLPAVLGELSAGLVISPYLLGGMPIPGFPEGLFFVPRAVGVADIPVSPELYGMGALAAVVLLFMVGLETDLKLFLRYSVAGGLVGIGGVVISFLGGNLLTVTLATHLVGRELHFMDPLCLMMGVIFTATSVGISSRILAEHRKLDTPEGVTILAGAVIDDLLGVVLLAVVLGVIAASSHPGEGVQWSIVLRIAVQAVVISMAATALGLMAARWVSGLLKLFRRRTVIAVMALGLALIVSGLFEQAGLAMIVGAYVTGLSLSRTDLRNVIIERLHVLQVMLVPVFFVVMGMLVDVRQLLSPQTAILGLIFFVAAVLTKLIGCGLPPLLSGFNLRGGLRIGVGMVPRGEIALLMAGMAMASGVLTQEILSIVVAVTLLSSIVAPPMMILAFRGPKPGVRKQPPASEDRQIAFRFPSMAVAAMLMDKLTAAFESEGFYVYAIDRDEGLYQLCKDDVMIGLRGTGNDITFTCQQREIVFVHTAMIEVVAAVEQTIRELRKPLDAKEIQRSLQVASAERGPESPTQVSLRAYLQPETLCPSLKASTREGVIMELLDLIAATGALTDEEAAFEAILERERSLSTGLEHGIAIPHAKTAAVSRLVCAVGLKSEGVDFTSIDGHPAHIVVLTLSPLAASAPYLQFISTVSKVLNDQGRAALSACDSPEEMYAVLTGAGRPRKHAFWHRSSEEPAWLASLSPDRVVTDLVPTSRNGIVATLLALCAREGNVKIRMDDINIQVLGVRMFNRGESVSECAQCPDIF